MILTSFEGFGLEKESGEDEASEMEIGRVKMSKAYRDRPRVVKTMLLLLLQHAKKEESSRKR